VERQRAVANQHRRWCVVLTLHWVPALPLCVKASKVYRRRTKTKNAHREGAPEEQRGVGEHRKHITVQCCIQYSLKGTGSKA
jgi:hypothetical protein